MDTNAALKTAKGWASREPNEIYTNDISVAVASAESMARAYIAQHAELATLKDCNESLHDRCYTAESELAKVQEQLRVAVEAGNALKAETGKLLRNMQANGYAHNGIPVKQGLRAIEEYNAAIAALKDAPIKGGGL